MLYHVIVERIHPKTGESMGRGPVRMTATPVTHNQGCTLLRKISNHPWRRKMLIEVQGSQPPA